MQMMIASTIKSVTQKESVIFIVRGHCANMSSTLPDIAQTFEPHYSSIVILLIGNLDLNADGNSQRAAGSTHLK
jgi:hypothetical protein